MSTLPDLKEADFGSVADAAKILGVSVSTARRLADAGVLKTWRLGPRTQRRINLKHCLRVRDTLRGAVDA